MIIPMRDLCGEGKAMLGLWDVGTGPLQLKLHVLSAWIFRACSRRPRGGGSRRPAAQHRGQPDR